MCITLTIAAIYNDLACTAAGFLTIIFNHVLTYIVHLRQHTEGAKASGKAII